LTLSQCLFFKWDESLVSHIWLGLVFLRPVCYSISFHWGTEVIYIQLILRGVCCFIFIPLLFSFTYSLFTGLLAQMGLFFLKSSGLTFFLLYVKVL
jgi:hypothetical protein